MKWIINMKDINKMLKIARYFGIIALIAIGIILNPWYKALRFDMMQRSLMNAWYDADASGRIPADVSASSLPKTHWSSSIAVIGGETSDDEVWEENNAPIFDSEYIKITWKGLLQ